MFAFSHSNLPLTISRGTPINSLNTPIIKEVVSAIGIENSLDTIPYNTDSFEAVLSVDSITYNKEFYLAYTSYDENHKGNLKICGLDQNPKVIVSGKNIFSPINMNESYILYFTLENKNVKIKICDHKGNLIKDISVMIVESE